VLLVVGREMKKHLLLPEMKTVVGVPEMSEQDIVDFIDELESSLRRQVTINDNFINIEHDPDFNPIDKNIKQKGIQLKKNKKRINRGLPPGKWKE
jgi:hypothetical protein